ncbi:MAG: nodulation protein NfeD, partial [Pseudomonadota bacterium]
STSSKTNANTLKSHKASAHRSFRRALSGLCLLMGTLAMGLSFTSLAQDAIDPSTRPEGVILTLEGAVTPTMADYIEREITAASDAGKDLVVLEIDTPGGLVDSMKTIIKSILASDTPVATFVSPQGARSASAGVYIMYAAHVSAMAPATNTGSATPVTLGGSPGDGDENPFDEEPTETDAPATDETDAAAPDTDVEDTSDALETAREAADEVRPRARENNESRPLSNDDALRAKMINDSVAYIRSLAELRGRNADWAEDAVRNAANVPASEALTLNVIDLIADDLDDLLEKIDGKTVSVKGKDQTIRTENIVLTRIEPTFAEKVLGFFANPNVAAILMSLGTTGLIIEMWNPGSILPGSVGLISLLLGLYSFQVLPFSWLGVALIIVGVLFMVLEAFTPTLGILGFIGLLCFGAGLYLLFPDEFRVSSGIIITSMALTGSLLALLLFVIAGTRGGGPMLGGEAIRRREGVVDSWDGLEGHVIVEGERWRARSNQPLTAGDRIKVTEVDGLVLVVRKLKNESGGLLPGARPAEA